MKSDNRGFALVITLIVTALLVALVTEFIAAVYVDTTSKQSFVDAQKAGLIAESGVDMVINKVPLQYLLPHNDYTSLQDPWAQPLVFTEEQGSLRITMEDENARLSLNQIVLGDNGKFTGENSFYGVALRLFRRLKLPASDLCDAIADWVDINDLPNPGGAESQWYVSRKPSFPAKNAWLDSVEELPLVKGFNSDVLEKLRPFVTVYRNSKINVNTAPKELLMALDEGITDSWAEQIIARRKSTPFKTVGEFTGFVGKDISITVIDVKSTIFRIKAEAQVNGTIRVVEAVVRYPDRKKLYWREY